MKTKTLIELIEFMEMYEKEIEKIILDYDGSKSKFDSLEELEEEAFKYGFESESIVIHEINKKTKVLTIYM